MARKFFTILFIFLFLFSNYNFVDAVSDLAITGSVSFTGTTGVAMPITDLQITGTTPSTTPVKLFTTSGIHISRSQARRILSGLEKFKVIILDFDKVPVVGQAFADEIYRVFQHLHPDIVIQEENMSEGVKFMVERAKNESKKTY